MLNICPNIDLIPLLFMVGMKETNETRRQLPTDSGGSVVSIRRKNLLKVVKI